MNNSKRLKFLQSIVCLGFLAGIFFSFELWLPINRTFPRVPVFIDVSMWFDRLLTIILIISLVSIIIFPKRKICKFSAITSLLFLAIFDQMRLQPWVYQYFLIIVLFTFHDWKKKISSPTLLLIQLLIASLYIWSGLQKLNYNFVFETLPLFLSPLQTLVSINKLPLIFLGLTWAMIEIIIGCGLIFHKTRRFSIYSAIIMHTIILTLLIAKNYNQIVWFWNATLILLVFCSFWKTDNSIFEITQNTISGREFLITIIVFASAILPFLSFFGLWDMNLSGALYSGRNEVGVIRVNENLFENLPPQIKKVIFETKNDNQKILPLFEWSMNELNIPVNPEERIFKKITRKVCGFAREKNKIELIVKKSPTIIDGSFELNRFDCNQLGVF